MSLAPEVRESRRLTLVAAQDALAADTFGRDLARLLGPHHPAGARE